MGRMDNEQNTKWTGGIMMGASLLVALVVAGCGKSEPQPTPAPTPAPTMTCPEDDNKEFTMYLPSLKKNMTFPPLPTNVTKYSYATDYARVVIPAKCKDMYKDKITDSVPYADRGPPDGQQELLFFRVSTADGKYGLLKEMMSTCACGLVINLHGSSGNWNVMNHAAMLAAVGYVVVMPDSMAMPDSMGLKGSTPLKNIADIDMDNWCGSYKAYENSCSKFSKPYCYKTNVTNILNDQEKYRKYINRVYLIRKYELDHFVSSQQQLLKAADKVFLMGGSEGGMLASRYYHKDLFKSLNGTIAISWSCEFNYFTPCEAEARVCGDQCEKTLPQLNLIGDDDEFFGPASDSVAYKVATSPEGYGADTITGNCAAAYKAQGFTKATVVLFDQTGHSPFYWNDNVLRNVLADFVHAPKSAAASWPSLETGTTCRKDGDVFKCAPLGPLTCGGSDYKTNPNATWNFTGEVGKCHDNPTESVVIV